MLVASKEATVDSTMSQGADGTSGRSPVAATTSEPPELFGKDFDLPAWIDKDRPDRH